MANAPRISWFEGTNSTANTVGAKLDYQTVDADSQSATKVLYIWNNRSGADDCSKMEEVTITQRDRNGGLGNSPGQEVEAVRDNWYHVRVDSLGESAFIPIGRGGISSNPTGEKALGTNGTTTNINAANAIAWTTASVVNDGQYVKPTLANGFIYLATVTGTTGATEPVWSTTENNVVTDGSVSYTAVRIAKTPAVQEILGLANSTLADGSNAADAGGNFAQVSMYADVPITASSGLNQSLTRISYRYV